MLRTQLGLPFLFDCSYLIPTVIWSLLVPLENSNPLKTPNKDYALCCMWMEEKPLNSRDGVGAEPSACLLLGTGQPGSVALYGEGGLREPDLQKTRGTRG